MKHSAETVALGTKGKLDEEDELPPTDYNTSGAGTVAPTTQKICQCKHPVLARLPIEPHIVHALIRCYG
jgi:hypothetical protein